MSKKHRWGGKVEEGDIPRIKTWEERVRDKFRPSNAGNLDEAIAEEAMELAEIRATRIAQLEKECDERFSWRFCEIACLVSLMIGAAFGFVVCLVTR